MLVQFHFMRAGATIGQGVHKHLVLRGYSEGFRQDVTGMCAYRLLEPTIPIA